MSPEPMTVPSVGASVTYLADPDEDPAATTTTTKAPTIPYGAAVPPGIDIDAIRKDLQATGVSAPADQVPALKQVVAYAKSKGHDVKIVVLTTKQPKFTYYRDVAIQLQQSVGGNVLVLGPNSVGSQGPDFARVDQEEAAASGLTLTNPPQAARQFVDDLIAPSLNWTAITLVLMFVVFIGAVVARFLGTRRKDRAAVADAQADDPSVSADSVDAPETDSAGAS